VQWIESTKKDPMNTPAFNLPQSRSLLAITREDLEEADLGWLDSMRAKLAAKHGVPVQQVVFNQMSYSDRSIFGEFVVRQVRAASPAA
jgi:hypothetical protein